MFISGVFLSFPKQAGPMTGCPPNKESKKLSLLWVVDKTEVLLPEAKPFEGEVDEV
jgi:hypothetical protein